MRSQSGRVLKPMDFRLTEAQQEMQSAARAYAQDKLPELADHIERTAEPPTHELIKEYAEMGFLGINIPEALGGLGQTSLDALIVLEEFGKISSAIAFPVFESCTGPVKAIEHFGTDALKQRVVPAVCAGEMVVAIAMSEPTAGRALTGLTTRAEVGSDRIAHDGEELTSAPVQHIGAVESGGHWKRMTDEVRLWFN